MNLERASIFETPKAQAKPSGDSLPVQLATLDQIAGLIRSLAGEHCANELFDPFKQDRKNVASQLVTLDGDRITRINFECDRLSRLMLTGLAALQASKSRKCSSAEAGPQTEGVRIAAATLYREICRDAHAIDALLRG